MQSFGHPDEAAEPSLSLPDDGFSDRLIVCANVLMAIRLVETYRNYVDDWPIRMNVLSFERCKWLIHPSLSWEQVAEFIQSEQVRLKIPPPPSH
jgi:hypothetical protein